MRATGSSISIDDKDVFAVTAFGVIIVSVASIRTSLKAYSLVDLSVVPPVHGKLYAGLAIVISLAWVTTMSFGVFNRFV